MKDWFNVDKNHWKSMEDKTQPLLNIQRWAGSFRKTEPSVFDIMLPSNVVNKYYHKLRWDLTDRNTNQKQLIGCI